MTGMRFLSIDGIWGLFDQEKSAVAQRTSIWDVL